MSADDDRIGTDEKTDTEDEALASLRAGLEATPEATRRFVLGTLLAAGPIVLTARPAWAHQAISVPDCEIVICLDRKRCERDDDDDDDDDDRHRNQTGRGHDEHGQGYGYGHHKDRDDDDDDCDDDDDDDDRHRNQTGRGHDEHGRGHGYGHHKGGGGDDDDCDETVVVNARNYIDFAADGRFDEPIYPTSQTGPHVSPQEAARIRKAIRRLARGRARVIASTSCWTSAMDFLTQNRRRH